MEFAKYSKKYIHYYGSEIPHLIKNILDTVPIKTMADLGCGDGAILCSLLKNGYLNKIEKIIAVDLSPLRISNVIKLNQRIQGVISDVCKLDMLANNSLELAISNQVIEHILDPDKFLQEVYRVLSYGGFFYLSTVFKKWYGWYFYRSGGRWRLDPTHVREYQEENELLNILRKYNFEILKNRKVLHRFAITDFILKRIGLKPNIYDTNKFLNFLRNIKIPIIGYYNWELVLKKAKQ